MSAQLGGNGAARRELGLTAAAGAAGAGITLLAVAQPWARASFAPSPPLPASSVIVTGHELAPATGALGVAALACLAAVLVTRGAARRVSGGALAVLGALTTATALAAAQRPHVAAAAATHSPAGAVGGSGPRLAMEAFPWWAAAMAGGLLILAAGVAAAWRGTRWPGMPSRYSRPPGGAAGGPSPAAADDQATAWDALDRGGDPTVPDPRG